jgi:hypothetical protein
MNDIVSIRKTRPLPTSPGCIGFDLVCAAEARSETAAGPGATLTGGDFFLAGKNPSLAATEY